MTMSRAVVYTKELFYSHKEYEGHDGNEDTQEYTTLLYMYKAPVNKHVA
jgi:hypothetical protein